MAGIGFHLPGANGVGHEAEPKQDDMPDSSNSQTNHSKLGLLDIGIYPRLKHSGTSL